MSNRIHISDRDTYNIPIGEPVLLLKKSIHENRGTWDYSIVAYPPVWPQFFTLLGLGEKCLAIGEIDECKPNFRIKWSTTL